jgi:biotin operon repressor
LVGGLIDAARKAASVGEPLTSGFAFWEDWPPVRAILEDAERGDADTVTEHLNILGKFDTAYRANVCNHIADVIDLPRSPPQPYSAATPLHPETAATGGQPEAGSGQVAFKVIPEHAAILKTLLEMTPTTITVRAIEDKLNLSEKTIRKHLQCLRDHGFTEMHGKKGSSLTEIGQELAKELPEDAGDEYMKKPITSGH